MLRLATLVAAATLASAAPRAPTIPQLAEAVPDLSTLVTLLKTADLVDALSGSGPFTVFAPSNEAFAALPAEVVKYLTSPEGATALKEILTYHVVAGAAVFSRELYNDESVKTLEGQNVTVKIAGGPFDKRIAILDAAGTRPAEVTAKDNVASNGVVHIIDAVLLPGKINPNPSPSGEKTIVQLAEATSSLSTLVKAVVAADLVQTLSGPGPFTVFAPTNDAFNALPPGVLENLLKPENKAELVKILTFHVVSGNIQAKDIHNDEVIKTVEGEKLLAHVSSSGVYLQTSWAERFLAKVIQANVEASNGVVHVIDKVLLPPQ